MTEVLGLKIQQWTIPHSNKTNNYMHKKNEEEKALMKFALLHPLLHGENIKKAVSLAWLTVATVTWTEGQCIEIILGD